MHVPMRDRDRYDSKNNFTDARPDFLALGIFVLNANGIIRYCTEGLLGRLGATLEQSCGQPIEKFIPHFPTNIEAGDFGAAIAATAKEFKLIQLQSLQGGRVTVRFAVRLIARKDRSSLIVIIEEVDAPNVNETQSMSTLSHRH